MDKNFHAVTQYSDYKGSVAADKADQVGLTSWLREKGLVNENELLLGTRMSVGVNHGTHSDPVSVTFLVSELNGVANVPELLATNDTTEVREIEQEMPISDFLALFKRFVITISRDGIFEGRSYSEE